MPGFAELSTPLSDLTKKETHYIWIKEQERAFFGLKRALKEAPVQIHFRPGRLTSIYTNIDKVCNTNTNDIFKLH